MSRFDRHEKSDRIKWIIIFTVVAALIVGFFAIVTKGFKQNDPKQWFSGEQITASAQSGSVEVSSGAKLTSSTGVPELDSLKFKYITENGVLYAGFPDRVGSFTYNGKNYSGGIVRYTICQYDELYISPIGERYEISSLYFNGKDMNKISVEDLIYNGMAERPSGGFGAGNYEIRCFYSFTYEDSEGVIHINDKITTEVFDYFEYSGDGVPLPETPSKTGYTFVGWYYDEAFTRPYDNQKITADTQLYAKFEAINYIITYNIQDWGDVNGKLSYTIADETYILPTPTRTGYDFLGWYDNSNFTGEPITEIPQGSTGNKTYYAKWKIQVYKVSFYVDGELYLEMDVEYGTRLVDLYLVDTQTLEAVAFSLDAEMLTAYSPESLITNDMSLFASEKFAVYAGLTYNIDGVETMDLLDYNSTLSDLRTPTKDGYTFDGWYYDAEYTKAVQPTDKLTSNKTIYAKFTEIQPETFGDKVAKFFTDWWWCFAAGAAIIVVGTVIIIIQKKRGARK